MKRIAKQIIFVFFNLLLMLALFVTSFAYLSASNISKGMSWHMSDPLGLLAIWFLSDPVFLVAGIGLLVLGERFQVSIFNRVIPFLAMAGLSFEVLGNDTAWLVGGIIGAVLLLATLAVTVMHFIPTRKRDEPPKPKPNLSLRA